MRRMAYAGAVFVVGLLPVAAAAAPSAPTYVTSEPQDGATLDRAPSEVSVTFSEPLDPSSTLQVFDQCGRPVDDGDEQVLGSRIDVGIARSPAGHYTAVYVAKGFGGATGETKGSFSFHVTSGEACGGGHGGHGEHGGEEGPGHEEGHGTGGDHKGEHGDGGTDHEGHGSASGHMSGGGDHPASHGSRSEHEGPGHGGSDHAREGHRKGHGEHHGKPGPATDERDGLGDLAAGPGGPGPAPTSTSVLVALGLSVALGALGGWVLRVSAGG